MAYCGPRGIPLSEFLNWEPDDQQAALAWQADHADRCRNCGTAEWEWVEDRYAFGVEMRVCRGCHLLGVEHKNQEKHLQDFPGAFLRLVPREEGEADG